MFYRQDHLELFEPVSGEKCEAGNLIILSEEDNLEKNPSPSTGSNMRLEASKDLVIFLPAT